MGECFTKIAHFGTSSYPHLTVFSAICLKMGGKIPENVGFSRFWLISHATRKDKSSVVIDVEQFLRSNCRKTLL